MAGKSDHIPSTMPVIANKSMKGARNGAGASNRQSSYNPMIENLKESTFDPDYSAIIRGRLLRAQKLNSNPIYTKAAREYYKTRPVEFINDWCQTFDPRNALKDLPSKIPFITFPRQDELIEFLYQCVKEEESGLIEKCRDVGATWICCAFSVWLWLFVDGSSVGWGSRKEMLVDRLGDMDSIFEKMRFIIDTLPRALWPEGFSLDKHAGYMKIYNPENGNTITGEAGDNIGRGGRNTIYFKDESAFYERAEKIEGAVSENTNVQIDLSSVPEGTNNVFTRRRKAGVIWEPGKEIEKGKTRVFIFDWRDHPNKTQEWYNRKRKKAEEEGMLHVFAREIDRDPVSSVYNILIPKAWVQAAIDAHEKLGIKLEGLTYAAMDVADDGIDKTALGARKGIVLIHLDQWPEGDTGKSLRRALPVLRDLKAGSFRYDCIGVGSGVKTEINRLKGVKGALPKKMQIVPYNAGDDVVWPNERVIRHDKESPKNKDFYLNIRAQAGWLLRQKFEKTFKSVVKGEINDYSELISIPSDLPYVEELIDELSQPTFDHKDNGKLFIVKKAKGEKSPNLFDMTIMLYSPVHEKPTVLI